MLLFQNAGARGLRVRLVSNPSCDKDVLCSRSKGPASHQYIFQAVICCSTHTHTHTRLHIDTHTPTPLHTCTLPHAHTHTHACTSHTPSTHPHIRSHTHMLTHTHAHLHSPSHTLWMCFPGVTCWWMFATQPLASSQAILLISSWSQQITIRKAQCCKHL